MKFSNTHTYIHVESNQIALIFTTQNEKHSALCHIADVPIILQVDLAVRTTKLL